MAPNGLAAVAMVRDTQYDLLFMDCQMPEMGGLEATATIRQAENGSRHVPIIAMTANAMEGDREECLSAGMDDYISKPIKKSNLAEALVRWAP